MAQQRRPWRTWSEAACPGVPAVKDRSWSPLLEPAVFVPASACRFPGLLDVLQLFLHLSLDPCIMKQLVEDVEYWFSSLC